MRVRSISVVLAMLACIYSKNAHALDILLTFDSRTALESWEKSITWGSVSSATFRTDEASVEVVFVDVGSGLISEASRSTFSRAAPVR
jgi:hypothetical protein